MRIGVFDSGIGGITVLSEIRKRLGSVDYVYLGDTAHLPYGTKSPAQVERLSVDCARVLKEKKVDVLVVACNTASSLAIDSIRLAMDPIPVFGMVEPGVEAVLSAIANLEKNTPSMTSKAPIVVLATRATVRSGAYSSALKKHLIPHLLTDEESHSVFELACPLLVPMIEEGWIDHPILHDTLALYVGPHLSETPGVALLGCTHYPWIIAAVQKSLPGWKVVDSANAVASALERSEFKIAKPLTRLGSGNVQWIFTDPDAVPAFATKMIHSMNSGEI
ncbi:MAG: glutamate racemase [Bdellovibrionia bacterium]